MRRALVCSLMLAGCGIGSNGLDQRASVAAVRITPATASVPEGGSIRLVAVALDADGNTVTPRSRLQWSTVDVTHVRVDTTGLVNALLAGPAEIRVQADSVMATARITVLALPAASVQIIVPQGPIVVGDTARFGAIVRNALGTRLTGTPVHWTTSDTTRARIDAAGLLSARAVGTVSVTAAADSASSVVPLTVFVPVATVAITPDSLALQYDDTARLTVTLRDSSGAILANRPVTWSIGDSSVITLSYNLAVAAVDAGRAIVTATAGHVTGRAVVDVAPLQLTSVSLGGQHTCGLRSDGAAFCWGDGTSGALGRGDTLSTVRPRRVAGTVTFSRLSAGIGFTCGLTPAGNGYCWGLNTSLQAGSVGGSPCPVTFNPTGNSAVCVLSPAPIQGGVTFSEIVAGETSSCGLTAGGAAYCWGAGGILGDSTTQPSASPVALVGGHLFRALGKPNSTGTCGLDTGGVVYCWSLAPIPIDSGTGFDTLTGASEMYCGLKSAALYCWGLIPIDDFSSQGHSPVRLLPGTLFASVAATGSHLCGVTTTGTAECWGSNRYGALGDATLVGHFDSTAATVTGSHHFVSLAVGGTFFGSHSCGLQTDGIFFCWGANAYGQVGKPVGANALVPVEPTGQP